MRDATCVSRLLLLDLGCLAQFAQHAHRHNRRPFGSRNTPDPTITYKMHPRAPRMDTPLNYIAVVPYARRIALKISILVLVCIIMGHRQTWLRVAVLPPAHAYISSIATQTRKIL